jgi:peroxiredoxin
MRHVDLLVTAVIVGASAYAVAKMAGDGPVAARPEVRAIDVGQPVEDVELVDIGGEKRRLLGWLGRKATVLYAFSVKCPCVGQVEERIQELMDRHRGKDGKDVVWVGVAGDAADSTEAVVEKMVALRAGYKMLLDPAQKLCRRVGFREATHVAVLDADGYLRYRGTIDDDLKKPTRSYLAEALAAVTEGRAPDVAEHDVEGYGCAFGEPAEDCPAGTP